MALVGKTDGYIVYKAGEVDNTLPVGAGGITNAYITYNKHDGIDIHKLDVYFTYKQDDKINLWEGTDASIGGRVEAFITYRPHDGLDIRKIDLYLLYKQEDKVDTFKIPYGIGGTLFAYILQRLNSLVGYLNTYDIEKVQAIIMGNNRYPLEDIQSFNDIPFFNNTTANKGG